MVAQIASTSRGLAPLFSRRGRGFCGFGGLSEGFAGPRGQGTGTGTARTPSSSTPSARSAARPPSRPNFAYERNFAYETHPHFGHFGRKRSHLVSEVATPGPLRHIALRLSRISLPYVSLIETICHASVT
jgi:hypothetical protein